MNTQNANRACAVGYRRNRLQLKRAAKTKTPLFDWAIGWLAREDKILITFEKRSFRIKLKDTYTKSTGTA